MTKHFNPKSKSPLNSNESLSVSTILGSGPRHFVFHPNHKFGYSIEELSGNVSVYQYNKGKLDSIQRIFAYSKKQKTYKSAEIAISPDGKFLYASNREENENSIAIFSIHPRKGKLTFIEHQSTFGDHPRNFIIDDSGKYLLVANQNTNNIVVFKRNLQTGLLTKMSKDTQVNKPVCLQLRTYK